MHSMEKTNTDAYETEIMCPATEMKVLKYIAGKWVIVIYRLEKPGRFKHKPSFQK
jgi:DNA-binding HxlR family transcriptional regulator